LAAQQTKEIGSALEETDDNKVVLFYPQTVIKDGPLGIMQRLQKLSSERIALHRRNLWWNIVGMPIVAPFALVPV
jgi:hypothetical protein